MSARGDLVPVRDLPIVGCELEDAVVVLHREVRVAVDRQLVQRDRSGLPHLPAIDGDGVVGSGSGRGPFRWWPLGQPEHEPLGVKKSCSSPPPPPLIVMAWFEPMNASCVLMSAFGSVTELKLVMFVPPLPLKV